MAKTPVGVGPKTRKSWCCSARPGISRTRNCCQAFFICSAGFIPKCRIVGVSLDAIDAEGFRAIAREAAFDRHDRKPHKEAWPAFAETLDYVPIAAGPQALKAAVDKAKRPSARRLSASTT